MEDLLSLACLARQPVPDDRIQGVIGAAAVHADPAERVFQDNYGKSLAEFYDDSKYQLMHLDLFPYGIIHAECVGGDIDLLLNQRATIGFFPWRFVDGEASIGRCVAFVDDDRYEQLMALKADLPKNKFGDASDPAHVESLTKLSRSFGF